MTLPSLPFLMGPDLPSADIIQIAYDARDEVKSARKRFQKIKIQITFVRLYARYPDIGDPIRQELRLPFRGPKAISL